MNNWRLGIHPLTFCTTFKPSVQWGNERYRINKRLTDEWYVLDKNKLTKLYVIWIVSTEHGERPTWMSDGWEKKDRWVMEEIRKSEGEGKGLPSCPSRIYTNPTDPHRKSHRVHGPLIGGSEVILDRGISILIRERQCVSFATTLKRCKMRKNKRKVEIFTWKNQYQQILSISQWKWITINRWYRYQDSNSK